jgi:hypothetical protein
MYRARNEATVGFMKQPNAPIAWRRGRGPTYVGVASRGSDAIRLTGRDPNLGIDVALSIPTDEIDHVGIATASGDGNPSVILELAESDPIYLRPVGGTLQHVHLLARTLGAPTNPPPVLAQGGRT